MGVASALEQSKSSVLQAVSVTLENDAFEKLNSSLTGDSAIRYIGILACKVGRRCTDLSLILQNQMVPCPSNQSPRISFSGDYYTRWYTCAL